MATVVTLTDAEYAAIGRIAVESAYLEEFVLALCIRLCRLKRPIGEIVLGRGLLDTRLQNLEAIVEHVLENSPEKLARFKKLISKIRINNDERNTAIHGRWVNATLNDLLSGLSRNPRAIKARAKTKKELKIADAVALSIRIEASAEELWLLAKQTWPQLFALRLRGLPKPRGANRRTKTSTTPSNSPLPPKRSP
jgi:hypothetical protein